MSLFGFNKRSGWGPFHCNYAYQGSGQECSTHAFDERNNFSNFNPSQDSFRSDEFKEYLEGSGFNDTKEYCNARSTFHVVKRGCARPTVVNAFGTEGHMTSSRESMFYRDQYEHCNFKGFGYVNEVGRDFL